MKSRLSILLAILLAGTGCEEPHAPPSVVLDFSGADDTCTPAVMGDCEVVFEEVASIEGEVDGIAPREPIFRLSDGRFVTGTFQPGKFAVWSETGRLLHVAGEGPGQGPGQFTFAIAFTEDADGNVIVIPGRPLEHSYSSDGTFLDSRRVGDLSGVSSVARFEGSFVGSTGSSPGSPTAYAWNADSTWHFGPEKDDGYPTLVTASAELGIWSVGVLDAVVRRHQHPSGAVEDSFSAVAPEVLGQPENQGNVYDLNVDDRGLVWVLLSVPDPEAPDRPRPPFEDDAQWRGVITRYRDSLLIGFGPTGVPVVETRFDFYLEAPRPLGPHLWYRVDSAGLVPSIDILRSKFVDPA